MRTSSRYAAKSGFFATSTLTCAQQIEGRVYGITGGGQGLGLTQAQFLAEQGAHGKCQTLERHHFRTDLFSAYAIDRTPSPSEEFRAVQHKIAKEHTGTLSYVQADVRDSERQDIIFEEMAAKHGRMDGLVSCAAVQNVTRVMDYPVEKISEVRCSPRLQHARRLTTCR